MASFCFLLAREKKKKEKDSFPSFARKWSEECSYSFMIVCSKENAFFFESCSCRPPIKHVTELEVLVFFGGAEVGRGR
jgi:hypothetical protein